MYLRIKRIKGNEYAYLVKNKWKKLGEKKGARQRVKRYLGRIFSYEIKNMADFFKFINIEPGHYLENNNYENILKDLIKWEFYKHDIKEEFLIYSNGRVRKENKDVCIKINNGILCGYTLKRLIRFDGKGSEPEVGKRLAKALIEAGINIPQEVFIGLFEKVFEEE